MKIELSEINITPIPPRGGLLAFVSFVINNSFFIANVALYSKLSGGYRLAYPLRTLPANGKQIYSFRPINKITAETIEKQVINKFTEIMDKVKIMNGENGYGDCNK